MRFGDLPTWAKELSTCIRELIKFSDYDPESIDTKEQECIFPSDLLHREPLFNQLIVNSYQPGEVRDDLFVLFNHVHFLDLFQ